MLGSPPESVSLRDCPVLALFGFLLIAGVLTLWYFLHFRPAATGRLRPTLLITLGLILFVMHVRALAFERVQVNGSSMAPTLSEGQAFWVRKTGVLDLGFPFSFRIGLRPWKPETGQIIVYRYPTGNGCIHPLWIKRVVATGGDSYRFANGTLFVNGKAELYSADSHTFNPPKTYPYPENYQPPLPTIPDAVRALGVEAQYAAMNGLPVSGTVPRLSVLVLGDNRSHSRDSRTIGFIPESFILGYVPSR